RWGYTPLESVAFVVLSITTTLAGFGLWALDSGRKGIKNAGVEVVERTDSNYGDAVAAITDELRSLTCAPASDIKSAREGAMDTAAMAQWTDFIKYYDEAYCDALHTRDNRVKEK
nr:glycosyl transferase [Muribaculaceae bacterium]